jgi:hypothetical protein
MKVWNYVVIISALMVLFYLAGFNQSAGYVLGTLNLAEDPESLTTDQRNTPGISQSNANLYTVVILILLSVAVIGVSIGFITKSSPELYITAGMAALLLAFLADMIWIILQIKAECGDISSTCNWVVWVVIFLVAPLSVGYLISIIDWWRGRG